MIREFESITSEAKLARINKWFGSFCGAVRTLPERETKPLMVKVYEGNDRIYNIFKKEGVVDSMRLIEDQSVFELEILRKMVRRMDEQYKAACVELVKECRFESNSAATRPIGREYEHHVAEERRRREEQIRVATTTKPLSENLKVGLISSIA